MTGGWRHRCGLRGRLPQWTDPPEVNRLRQRQRHADGRRWPRAVAGRTGKCGAFEYTRLDSPGRQPAGGSVGAPSSEPAVAAARSGVGAIDDDGRGDGPVRLAVSA